MGTSRENGNYIFTPSRRHTKRMAMARGLSLDEYYELLMTKRGTIPLWEGLPKRTQSAKEVWSVEDYEKFDQAEKLWSIIKHDPRNGHS